MNLHIIDFDKKFEEYMKQWLDENSDSFDDMDELETGMPNIYDKWLNTSAPWLDGMKPCEYFANYDAKDLIQIMIGYSTQKIGLPDPLLDAISSKKDDALICLGDVIFDKIKLPEEIDSVAIKITALNMINEINPEQYIEKYIHQIQVLDLDDGIAEIMVETIKEYINEYESIIIKALEDTDDIEIKKRLLDILVIASYQETVYKALVDMFINSDEKALYASYLGKYDNPEACEVLIKSLDWLDINYLDYIEIKNSIEILGGETSHSRIFDGDIYYESMKGLEDGE